MDRTTPELSQDHLDHFLLHGFCCIEHVLSESAVQDARDAFHSELARSGIRHDEILSRDPTALHDLSVARRTGEGAANLFYAPFKMDIQLTPEMRAIWKTVLDAVASTSPPTPFGPHTDILPYIDRTCYRLPDHLGAEGGLGLHLDRRPGPKGLQNIKKYRPVQGFVTLTDHYGPESGGLQLVRGFHHEFDSFFKEGAYAEESAGEFFRMHGKSYTKLQEKLETLDVPAGTLVLWDNRLPHATCTKLSGFDTREVVYLSYLPNVPLNVEYARCQAEAYVLNQPPPAYNTGTKLLLSVDRPLTPYQKQELRVNPRR